MSENESDPPKNLPASVGLSTTTEIAPVRTPVWPLPGTVVISPHQAGRKYTFGEQIGFGNFSFVFAGTDSWGDEVAIKAFRPQHGTFEQVGRMALDEALKMAFLRHPRITYIHDAFEFQNVFYVVAEMCGAPVSQLVNKTKYDGRVWVKPIARCLLNALAFIHDAGYVHQDIHIDNVFLSWAKCELLPDEPWHVSFKVGDLGLAKPVKQINPANTVLADWMYAPEYLDGQSFGPMDHRMDLYHASLTLLQVLTGHPLLLTRDDILNGVPRQMAEVLGPFGQALSNGLRRHVADRPHTALQLWEHLETHMP